MLEYTYPRTTPFASAPRYRQLGCFHLYTNVRVCEACKHQFLLISTDSPDQRKCDACTLESMLPLLPVKLKKAEKNKLREFIGIMESKEVYLKETFNIPPRSESLSDCSKNLLSSKLKT